MIVIVNVGIFLNDSKLIEWLSLECLSCGADVRCFFTPNRELELCDVVFCDIDMSVSLPQGEYFLVGISRGDDLAKENFDRVLHYPFLLEEIRGIIFNLFGGDADKNRNETNKASRYTIYIDEKRRQAELLNVKISLSDYELRVLKRLCKTPSCAVSREELSALFEKEVGGNMVDVYICHLRKKFESVTHEKVIYTVRGKGYMTNYFIKELK